MDVNKLFQILRGTDHSAMLPEVPKDVKKKMLYIVDNRCNVRTTRRANGQKNMFGVDCRAWSTRDGHVLTSHYRCCENCDCKLL